MRPKSDREAPEPMAIILSRQEDVLRLPPYRKPNVNERAMDDAARLHADLHNSDPFALARITHYMAQGFELVSDVAADARRGLQVRESAKRMRTA